MQTLRVDLGARSYDIAIGRGLLGDAARLFLKAAPAQRALVLTDSHVKQLYAEQVLASLNAAGCRSALCVVPAGEQSKCLAQLGDVYAALSKHGVTRSDLLVAVGGGVVGDLGGFAAATYLRGIRYVQLPTTLLAQVDSAVGGKTAIDLPSGKNLAGAFHQPTSVVIDPDVLETLDDRVFLDGMGEVIKYALTFDETLLAPIGRNRAQAQAHMDEVVYRCLDLKRRVVEDDERDVGSRMLLNFGHTLAHSIEAAEHFQGHTHGEAVAAGMHLVTRLSEAAGITAPGSAQTIHDLLTAWGLPTTCARTLWPAMHDTLSCDKKHLDGTLHAILLDRIGHAQIKPVSETFFEGVTAWLT